MPYEARGGFQRARRLGHVPVVQNELVRERLGHYQMPDRSGVGVVLDPYLHDPDIAGARTRRYCIAVDGSQYEEEVDARYPSARLGFIQVAGALVDTTQLASSRVDGLVDPVRLREAIGRTVLAGFVPSSNLPLPNPSGAGVMDPVSSFRSELRRLFASTSVEGFTLLATLRQVWAAGGRSQQGDQELLLARCPNEDCGSRADAGAEVPCRVRLDRPGIDPGSPDTMCKHCGDPLYATDVMRLHECFNPWGPNGEMLGGLMQAVEHLMLAAVMLGVRERGLPALSEVCFVRDGPLALHGEVAPLHSGLAALWQRVSDEAEEAGLPFPLLVGVEKSGVVVDHANAVRERIPPRRVLTLPFEYVRDHVQYGVKPNFHVETYYGRQFVYRASDGRLHVLSIPPHHPDHGRAYGPSGTHLPAAYPTLGETCAMLDRLGTRMYHDALLPVSLAHEYAAFPLETAGQVLSVFARRQLDGAGRTTMGSEAISAGKTEPA